MATATTKTPRITELADRLLADIRARNLASGDRYLTTAQTSKLLGVGNAAANRALQLLERRNVITRQQRSGAYIAKLPDDSERLPLRRVHFLVHQKFLRTDGIGTDQILIGMQDKLPGVNVQISFLPSGDEASFVSVLINDALKSSSVDGFVLVRASCEAQKLMAASGLPVVVFGDVYPGVERLAWVSRDMHAVGKQLSQYLLDRGHRRIAYLNRQQALPGDHKTIDSIIATMAGAGLPVDALSVRFVPADAQICRAEIEQLLRRKQRPTGFICRTVPTAEAARRVIETMIPRRHERFDVAVCDYYLRPNEKAQFAFPRPLGTIEEQGHHLARLLAMQTRKGAPEQSEVVIPVKLWIPEEGER